MSSSDNLHLHYTIEKWRAAIAPVICNESLRGSLLINL